MTMNKFLYGGNFHLTRDADTQYAAHRILSILYQEFSNLDRVVDVGCGVGTFLNAALACGAHTVKGIDGDWVNPGHLVIQQSNFEALDISTHPVINEKFDLAINLEVAEHLPKENAAAFIHWLVALAPVILFSAAIPGQGGIGHKNEAWPSYWVSIFRQEGYEPLDIVRSKIWDDHEIYFWYRQNIFVFVKTNYILSSNFNPSFFDIVHPELYLSKIVRNRGWPANAFFLSLLRRLLSLVNHK